MTAAEQPAGAGRVRDALIERVYEHLDPDGMGWAAGDGPGVEQVVDAVLAIDAVTQPLAARVTTPSKQEIHDLMLLHQCIEPDGVESIACECGEPLGIPAHQWSSLAYHQADVLAGLLADDSDDSDAPTIESDEVLVEGSWFKVSDLPGILGRYMRSADAAMREAKEAAMQRDELRELLTTPLPDAPTIERARADAWDRGISAAQIIADECCGCTLIGKEPNPYRASEGGDDAER